MRAAVPIDVRALDKATLSRFWEKVTKTSGCWLWTGALGNGYGRFKVNGRLYGAHRLAVVIATGEDVPAGLVIDHLCRTPACVNPDHLECVTLRENTLRGVAPNAHGARMRAAGLCPGGHDLNATGHRYPSGRIGCRACITAYRARPDVKERSRLRAIEARAEGRWVGRKKK